MADHEVKIRISADATQAVTGIDNVGRRMKQFETDSDGLVRTLQAHWLKVSAAIAGVAIVANKSWDMAYATAQFEQSRAAFNSMVNSMGADADRLYQQLRDKSANLIDSKSLVESANRAMSLGIPVEKLGELMEVARAKARDMGITTTQAFNDIATGVGRASPLILDNLGLVIKVGEANQRMADELHKNVGVLTEKEKKIAILNAALDSGKEALSRYNMAQNTTLENMQRVTAAAKDMQLMLGQVLLRAVSGLAGAFQWLSAGVMGLVSYLVRGVEYLSAFSAKIYEWTGQTERMKAQREETEKWKRLADDMQGAAGELTGKAVDKFGVMIASTNELARASSRSIQPINEKVQELTNNTEALLKSWREMERTLSTKIESQGLDELSQALLKNQMEADALKDRFKDLPDTIRRAAYALIEKAKAADDLTAQTKRTTAALDVEIARLKELAGLKDRYGQQMRSVEHEIMPEFDRQYAIERELEQKRHDFINDMRAKGVIDHQRAQADMLKATEARIKAEQAITSQKYIYEKAQQEDIARATSQMFSMAASLYSEDSKERKKLSDLSKAATMAEIALQVQKNLMIAVGAVVNQGTGDPYTAFARIAAMIGVVTGVLSIAGIAFGGGGASGGPSNPAMGNSTVFGAAYGTGSESLANSLAILEDTYDMTDRRLVNIYNEIKTLNSNIMGLVQNIIRTSGGFDTSGGFGVQMGQTQPGWTSGFGSGASHASHFFVTDPFFSMTHELFNWMGKGMLAENIGRVMSDIFGGGQEVWSTGSGIETRGGRVSDLMTGGSSGVRGYQDITRRTGTDWWRDDSYDYETHYKALDGNVTRMFDMLYQSMSRSLMDIAGQLGGDMQRTLDYVFAETKINLANMTGEEMNKALQEHFSSEADKAVESLFGGLISQYQKLNEGLMETAIRLIADKNSIMKILEYTNQLFTGTTSQLIKFSEALIEVAGDLSKLTDAFESYYSAFFSDAEKQDDLRKALSGALGEYGYALPGTRSGYRSLVESADLATEAGQAAYAALLMLSDSADQYYKYLEAARGKLNESDYATRADYLRATRGFAYGGMSYGPDSGYDATLHGTELIVSPRSSYPATVIGGGDSREVVSELKAIRSDLKEQAWKTEDAFRRVNIMLEQWDGDGIPEERAA